MRLALQLDRPNTGRVTFDGREYRTLAHPVREIGALLDAGSAHPGRSARNHLAAVAAAAGLPGRRVDEVLDVVGLSDVAGRRVGGYSLGMRQRLGLATALLGDPHTFLLDEPANGLDPEGISWTRQFLRYLAGQGRTVFVSSHLLGEMAQTADDLVVIGRGRLIAQTTVAEFVGQFASSYVFVRSPRLADLVALLRASGAEVEPEADGAKVRGRLAPAIGELAAAHGIVLHELAPRSASLEEAFLEVTHTESEYRGAPPP